MSSSDNGGRDTAPRWFLTANSMESVSWLPVAHAVSGPRSPSIYAIAVHEWRRWPALGARRTHRFRT